MIVRNEQANLPRALASVAPLGAELIIVDTGSTDDTPDIARVAGARVLHRPWTGDFSAARNAGLDAATGEWVMVLDADEALLEQDAATVMPLLQQGGAEGYICPVTNLVGSPANPDAERSELLRFWRHRPAYRWEGAVHEQIAHRIVAAGHGGLSRAPIRFIHWGYLEAQDTARGRKERNLNLLLQAVAQAPDSAFLRFNLAVEYARQQRWAEAAAEYRRAQAGAEPHWAPKLTKGLVHALLQAGEQTDAEAELTRALTDWPDFTDLLYFKGVLCCQQQRWADAAAAFGRAMALGPAPVPPYAGAEEGLGAWKAAFALGRVYQSLGRVHEAVNVYEQAMEQRSDWLPPLEATVQILLGAGVPADQVCAYAQGRLHGIEAAEKLPTVAGLLAAGGAYQTALDTLPPDAADPRTRYVRGHCLLRLGQPAAAEAELAAVPADSPWEAPARAEQAYCRWVAGDTVGARALAAGVTLAEAARPYLEEARAVLAEGLRRYPDAVVLHDLLARLGEGTA